MRAFLKMTGISMQGQLYYKTSFLLNLLTPVILLIGQYLLWNGLYAQQSGEQIGGMSQKMMYTYILIAFALNNLLSWSSENMLAREIRTGTVVTRCIRPVSFLSQVISGMLGGVILQGTVNAMIVILGLICFRDYMSIIPLQNIYLFLPCMFLAVLIRMMMIEIFSLICFFSTGHLGIVWTRQALTDFFSGALIPVVMFPVWLQKITYITPFPYMIQVPIAVLLGQELPFSIGGIYMIQMVWIAIFFLLHCVMYGVIRRNMNIAGG